jgi:hypothetical protein
MLITRPPDDPGELTEEETRRLQAARTFRTTGSGYSAIQGTRPQTLAYGLTDSPAGQLAWITEKFGEWTDNGRPDEAVDRDQLLTNVTLYWLTGTAGSSARLYYETARARAWSPAARSTVPTGVAVFPREIAPPIRRFAGQSDTIRTGPSSAAAATSRPWRCPTCWSATCASSSGRCAEAQRWPPGVTRPLS